MKTQKIHDMLREDLKDPHFKELHELDQQKLSVVKKIISYRIKHNLSQAELADLAGVSQQHISKIENGEFSSVFTLEKILLSIGYTVQIKAVPLSHNGSNHFQMA